MSALLQRSRGWRSRLAGAPCREHVARHQHVIHYEHPAFLVRRGRCEPAIGDPWRPSLMTSALTRAIACVGRFSSSESSRVSFGTAWRVRPDVIATNTHLARYFEERRRCAAAVVTIDFTGEYLGAGRPIVVGELLYAADDHDLAFMRIPLESPTVIELSPTACRPGTPVCTIGFPADNTRFYEPARIDRIFAGIYDVKRVAPGRVLAASAERVDHDCTTLGGNSGSVLLELATGQAVGIHADGVPFLRNHAVPAAIVHERLTLIGR